MRRLFLVLFSSLAAVVAAELAVRLSAAAKLSARTLEGRIEAAGKPEPGQPLRWVQALRVRPEADLVFDLRPELEAVVEVSGSMTPLRTDREGFRGPGYALEKPAGTVRLAALGDSFMMGSGLPEEDTISARLQRRLEERYPERRTEVINAGVAGYNLGQSVATLRRKVLAYDPDLVLVGLLENDRTRVIYVTRGTYDDPLFARRSILLDALGGREPSLRPEGTAPRDEAGLRRAMRDLVRLRAEHDLRLHAFTYYDSKVAVWMREEAARVGLPVDSTGPGVTAYMQAHGIEKRGQSELVISPTDGHPSALQVGLLVDQLVEQLEQRGHLRALYGRD
ncbi:MAG: hypothetical protein AAFZ65_18235 [Planctomycetota bacterium]